MDKKICSTCGELISLSRFYKSQSPFNYDGYMPICKDCFQRKFDFYNLQYHSAKKAMQRVCMAFDIYFQEDVFDNCDNENTRVLVGNYIRMLNMKQHKGKTFDTTIDEGGFDLSGDRRPVKNNRLAVIDEYGNEVEEAEGINRNDLEKWGIGLEPTDYTILKNHYNYIKKANPNCDSNQEIYVNNLCYTYMLQMKAVKEGNVDNYKKLIESYQKTFREGGLKTVQETQSSDDCWSMWTGIISQYTPEEYYKDKTLYKDWDKLGEYYERMAVRPLRNLQLGTNERDREFYVHEESEGE